MKLLAKFNLILILFLGAGWAIAAYVSHRFLMDNAREQVVRQAELMMESATSVRKYTSEQIKPLLEKTQMHTIRFLAQTVPAYGATTTFNNLRQSYPDYTYREATLNPTNLSDRAVDWESDIISNFRNHKDQKNLIGERDTPSGKSLFLSRPIKVVPSCLECHSTSDRAPKALIRVYGASNGFGWKPDEVIGAQIVSVPESVPVGIADKAFRELMTYLGIISLATVLLIDMALVFIVIRPVVKLSKMADRVSKGEIDMPEMAVKGHDEISILTESFNRMYVSLAKALKMLEG
jgi:HAMP domain-containing protein